MSSCRDAIDQVQISLRGIESRVTEMRQQNHYVIDKMDVDLLTSKLASLSVETGLLKKARDILESLDHDQRPVRLHPDCTSADLPMGISSAPSPWHGNPKPSTPCTR